MKENVPSPTQNGSAWRPSMWHYRDDDLCVVTFATTEDAYSALDMVWKGNLRGMPFAIPGSDALVVPKDSVHYFSEAGLRFDEAKLLNRDEVTSEELNELRKQFIY